MVAAGDRGTQGAAYRRMSLLIRRRTPHQSDPPDIRPAEGDAGLSGRPARAPELTGSAIRTSTRSRVSRRAGATLRYWSPGARRRHERRAGAAGRDGRGCCPGPFSATRTSTESGRPSTMQRLAAVDPPAGQLLGPGGEHHAAADGPDGEVPLVGLESDEARVLTRPLRFQPRHLRGPAGRPRLRLERGERVGPAPGGERALARDRSPGSRPAALPAGPARPRRA